MTALIDQKNAIVFITIPAIGKQVGEELSLGDLSGGGSLMRVNSFFCAVMIQRGGRIPAPLQALKNSFEVFRFMIGLIW